MVIFSNEIQDILLELYFSEFAKNVNTPRYFRLKTKLLSLDKPYINRKQGRYPAWRDMYEFQMGCYIFGYSWDGQTIYIEECFKEKIKESIYNTMKNNKKVIRLTEADLHKLIEESVKKYKDNNGNKLSGKQALIHGGRNVFGKWDFKTRANDAVSNQAKHLYKVLDNFLKTLKHNPFNIISSEEGKKSGHLFYDDDLMDLTQRLKNILFELIHYHDMDTIDQAIYLKNKNGQKTW